MIGVVDYGAGNLQSVGNALDRLGQRHRICRTPADLQGAERVMLPGVGHFGAAARGLAGAGLREALRRHVQDGRPLLGICLGMQLLLDGSDEAPGAEGLGLVGGRSVRLVGKTVPHMGWNRVTWIRPTDALPPEARQDTTPPHAYFAHAYRAVPEDAETILAVTSFEGQRLPAAIGRGRVLGLQFHPEKSDGAGLALLERFCRC